jgi:DNA-binding transcriptional LysR family regulator
MAAAISWDDFRLVKAIADARSLVGAADSLDLNHSTVFRRLGALEEQLGTKLFERSRTGYAPTAAGEEMIELAGRMDHDITDFERKVAGRDVKPAGDLRVTTNDAFLTHLLTPMFASFCRAYPDIRLEVIIANQSLNLSKRDADVAIRATAKPSENLIGRRITTLQWAAYAPKRWVEEGRNLDADDVPWVGFSETLSHLNAAEWINSTIGPRRVPYRVDTVLGLNCAVEAEIGLGLLPCFIGDQSPRIIRHGGRRGEVAGESLWLLTHADLKNSARVRAFMDHMAVEFIKVRRLLEGEI